MTILAKFFPALEDVFGEVRSRYLKKHMADDDIVDALVLAIGAQMVGDRELRRLPQPLERDKQGIPMAIHYVAMS